MKKKKTNKSDRIVKVKNVVSQQKIIHISCYNDVKFNANL